MPYAQRKHAQQFLIDKIMYTATNYLVHENMKKAKDLDPFLFYDLSEVLPTPRTVRAHLEKGKYKKTGNNYTDASSLPFFLFFRLFLFPFFLPVFFLCPLCHVFHLPFFSKKAPKQQLGNKPFEKQINTQNVVFALIHLMLEHHFQNVIFNVWCFRMPSEGFKVFLC